MHLYNSFISTTMCDDLARATEARDGKKKGLGEARRGLGEATPRTQNLLAQGQSEAHGDSKLHNTIVEVPGRLNLK